MNALATIQLPGRVMARSAIFRPASLTAIGLVIDRLEQLQFGPELEAEIFRALGWQASAGAPWRVRSPLSTAWMPLPPVTRVSDCAAILVPPGCDYSSGRRGVHGLSWVRRDGSTWFEANLGTPAQTLARCALHAWRHILLETHP